MSDITYDNVKQFQPIEFKLTPQPTPFEEAMANPTVWLLIAVVVIAAVALVLFLRQQKKE